MLLPAPRSHLATLVRDMQALGHQPAVVEYRGVRRFATTYRQLADGALRFAQQLEDRGIGSGQRVILWGANSASWIACFFGCVLRGVLVVPLDAAGSPAFAQRILAETMPLLVVGDRALLAKLSPADATSRIELTSLEPGRFHRDEPRDAALSYDALVSPTLSLDAPLQILFTSGTTGDPKGIVHTHRNLLASLAPIEREIAKYRRYERWVHPLRILHTLPLSHIFGQFMGLWVAPVLGAVVHFEARLGAARLLELLRRERISVLAAVPRVLTLLRTELLARSPGLARRLSASQQLQIWKRWWIFRGIHSLLGYKFWAIVCGGATLPAELEEFWTTLGIALIQGYGMTETSALVTLNHPFKPARGSLGAALPGRELRITETGELLVRGEMVATARWQAGSVHHPEGLSDSPSADDQSWLATGDLARRDAEGRLHFLGRTGQRLVTSAGLNVYLEDVEAALTAQPEITSAMAVPLQTEQGPQPAAVLVCSDEAKAEAAVAHANATLAAYQRVARWWLWPGLDLPRTATGKLRRQAVESWIAQQQQADNEHAREPRARDPLLALLTGITGQASIADAARQDAQSLEALGLDSLGRVQLQTALEEATGRPVDERALTAARTLGELRALAQAPRAEPIETEPIPSDRSKRELSDPAKPRPATRSEYHYPRWPWSWPARILRKLFIEIGVRPLVWLLARPQVLRSAAAVANEPMLIVANHVSSYDVPLILYALPAPLRRTVAVAAAGEMLRDWRRGRPSLGYPAWLGPPIYWLLTLLFHVFPLPRSYGFRASFAHAGAALDRGYSILIFPEGTRSHGSAMQTFRGGIGLLAGQAYAKVLPIALIEGRRTPGSFRPYAASVVVGSPLSIDPDADARAITALLEQEVSELLAQARDAASS